MDKFDASSPRRAQVDAKAIRRQVRSILHSLDRMRRSEAYWHVGAVANEVRRLLEQGWTKERKVWARKLETWQQEIDAYGVDDVFAAAHDAALQSWDDPQLQHVLQGTDSENDSWDGEEPELTVARLHILERRGRLQEYLHLARAEGQNEAYVAMLVRLGRTQEAAAYGRKHLEIAQEALTLARALYDRGEREQGLQIAEEGLVLQGPKADLAKWLRDKAENAGEKTRALAAAEVAFREELNLANYLRVAEIAREQWPEDRAKLLEHVRHTKSYTPHGSRALPSNHIPNG